MITLGQASNYTEKQAWAHFWAVGTGKDSHKLKVALAEKYQAKPENVGLYHTGRSALTVAIQKLAPKGGQVVVPGLTCIAVVRAIRAAGCKPVFLDIKPGTFEYDIDNLDKVCYNGGIVLVQNTLGIPWHVSKIERIAKKHKVKIIEDLAHSAGRFYPDGREVGTVGDVTVLSFGKGKAIDTISGGAVIMRNGAEIKQPRRLPKFIDRWRDRWYPVFGMYIRKHWDRGEGQLYLGALVKFGLIQRSADAELNTKRRLTHWQAKLALEQLHNLPTTPLREYHLVKKRQKVLQDLADNGFYFDEIWYDVPVSPKRYLAEADFPMRDCPETVRISELIINFPTWYSKEQLEPAYDIIKKYEVKL